MKNPKKLSGSTLIEVLTSLALLGIVFSLALMLFQQINGIHSPPQAFQSRMLLLELLNEPLEEPWQAHTETEQKGRRLIRKVRKLNHGLAEVEVDCYWKNRLLESRRRIIILK